jgi:EpsI family protein
MNSINPKTFYVSLIILIAAVVFVFLISQRGEPVVVETNLENLPMEIAGLKATRDSFSESVYKELNADKHVYRHYRSTDGKIIDLYIGYYGTAKVGRTGHNPYACFTGAGWGIVEAGMVKLKAGYKVVLHWYQSDKDKILITGIQMNIRRFIGRVLYNRNDGAFVRVSAQTDRQGIDETKKRVQSFAERIIAFLPNYWPVEK